MKYLCRLVERDTAETSGKKFLLQYWFIDELCLWSLEACLSIQACCCVKVTFFVPFLSSAIVKNISDIKFLKYKVFPSGFFPVLLKHLRGVIQSGVWLEGLPNLHEINMGPDFIVSLQLYHFHPISCWLLSMQCVFLIAEGKAEGAYLADSYHVFWCLEKKSFHWVCGIEDSIPQLGIMVRRRGWQVYQVRLMRQQVEQGRPQVRKHQQTYAVCSWTRAWISWQAEEAGGRGEEKFRRHFTFFLV